MSCKKFRRNIDRHLNKNPLSNEGRLILDNLPMSVGISFDEMFYMMKDRGILFHPGYLIRLIEAGYVEVV